MAIAERATDPGGSRWFAGPSRSFGSIWRRKYDQAAEAILDGRDVEAGAIVR